MAANPSDRRRDDTVPPMAPAQRRWLFGSLLAAFMLFVGWTYYRGLVPAIHPDHDHGLENLDGGGFLWVEADGGPRRNLVGRPDHVLILHFFELPSGHSEVELPLLRGYAAAVADESDVEVVFIGVAPSWKALRGAAGRLGLPQGQLYFDPRGETAQLIGVRRFPETLIYTPDGHLAHQARGPMDWGADTRAAIEAIKHRDGHSH